MKNIFSILIISTITAFLIYFMNNTYKQSINYENTYKAYSKTKTLNNNIQNEVGNILNSFMKLLTNTNTTNIIKKPIDYKKKLNMIKENIKTNIIYIMILLFITIALYFILNKTIVLSFLYIQSIVFLIYGLISPIFLMYITQEFGTNLVILQFESNSILSSIQKLFDQNNYFVGGIILLFSVIFPIIKTIISFISLHIKNIKILDKLSILSSKFAKLSMTDVFVLSIFLVYLSPKDDGMIKTELEIGFLFFFTYVIISLFIALTNKYNTKN